MLSQPVSQNMTELPVKIPTSSSFLLTKLPPYHRTNTTAPCKDPTRKYHMSKIHCYAHSSNEMDLCVPNCITCPFLTQGNLYSNLWELNPENQFYRLALGWLTKQHSRVRHFLPPEQAFFTNKRFI